MNKLDIAIEEVDKLSYRVERMTLIVYQKKNAGIPESEYQELSDALGNLKQHLKNAEEALANIKANIREEVINSIFDE